MRPSATRATPASRRAPPAPSTTGARSCARRPTRSKRSSAGTRCPRRRTSRPTTASTFPRRSCGSRSKQRRTRRLGTRPLVRGATGDQSALGRAPRAGDRHRQLRPHRGGRVERHSPHRARLRLDRLSGARRPDDRHRAAGRRCAGPAELRSPVFRGEPARRRSGRLQQRRAHRQTRHRGSRRQARARHHVELPVRSCQGRHGQGGGPVPAQLPDARSSWREPASDLHRHRIGADARDDGAAAPAHRAERRRPAHALLRRARRRRSSPTSARS